MTLSKDNKPKQSRTQKVIMWCIFGAAAILLVIAVVLFVTSGARFF